jgi:hypothetical protein
MAALRERQEAGARERKALLTQAPKTTSKPFENTAIKIESPPQMASNFQ